MPLCMGDPVPHLEMYGRVKIPVHARWPWSLDIMRAARNVSAPLTFARASASSLFSLGRRDAAPLLIAGIAQCVAPATRVWRCELRCEERRNEPGSLC